MQQRYVFLIDTKKNVLASERSELAGAEGLWTAEPDTVPMPWELRCRPLADCSAAGRMRTADIAELGGWEFLQSQQSMN